MSALILFVFLGAAVLAMPIAHALLVAAMTAAATSDRVPLDLLVQQMVAQVQSFPLIAIPFFMLTGSLMMGGKLGEALIGVLSTLIGRFHGGPGQVGVLSSTIFGGVSASAVADASAIGSLLIPWQKRLGYPPAFSAATLAAAATIDILIPPSIPMILFTLSSNTSVASLFVAGILPGLVLPVLIIVFLRVGIATPTEVSVLSTLYAGVVSAMIYRDLGFKRLHHAVVGLAKNFLDSPWAIILMMNILMLVCGMFIDLPAAVLLLTPVFVPLANAIGMDLVQLGIMMTVNLAIGLYTPPVGTTLFITSSLAKVKVGETVRELGPFYLVAFGVLMLVSYVPASILK